MIKVKNLRKAYGSTIAVNNVSFTVQKGEVLGFLGPNGAGKSTTMRILTCFMPPDSGEVRIADLDIAKDALAVRRKIGYLPENAPLYQDMGVIDYLSFIAEIRKIPVGERKERIKHMVGVCGLEKVVGKPIGHLSKGYRQRVGLAQAMIHDPDILILDEPTSGLDPSQIKEIRELIKEIGEKKTIILCTHILQEVSMTCRRVIIINEGQIAASGTPDELSAQAAGGETVQFIVKGPREHVQDSVEKLEGVLDCTFQETDGFGFHQFLINCDKGRRLTVDLFDLAVKEGWKVSTLHTTSASLEDVFLKLTTGEVSS